MNKKSVVFVLLVVGLFSVLTANLFAQTSDSTKTEQADKACTGEKFVMPSSIAVDDSAFEIYLKIAAASAGERRGLFSKL